VLSPSAGVHWVLYVCVCVGVQGSDPSQYEMIQKMQMLQKRLITKTEEVVEKELLIQEKEKLYMELKHILARQPGPEVAEQLQSYQATLKDKTRQMKVRVLALGIVMCGIVDFLIRFGFGFSHVGRPICGSETGHGNCEDSGDRV